MSVKKILTIMLLVLCFLNVSWAKEQEEEKKHQGYRVNAFVLMRLENASFYIYNPPFKAKGIYKSIEEAKNRTPEELFISMASETTQEWVDHNNWPGRSRTVSARAFAYRAQLDKEKNYRELLSKLSFSCWARSSRNLCSSFFLASLRAASSSLLF